jgi:hypothetical protein
MKRFASEFDCLERKSAWHIFESDSTAIRIAKSATDNADLYPRYDYDPQSLTIPPYVDIIYVIPSWSFKLGPLHDSHNWRKAVGLRGIWTAEYTRNWMLKEFIPEVLQRYGKEYRQHRSDSRAVIDHSRELATRMPLNRIDDHTELHDYLKDVQLWLSVNPKNISAALIQPYYESFIDLLRGVELGSVDVSYIAGNLGMLVGGYPPQLTAADIFIELDRRAVRVKTQGFEQHGSAERVSRVFMDLILIRKIKYTQPQLNAAVNALRRLWGERSFEMRYVMPEMWA